MNQKKTLCLVAAALLLTASFLGATKAKAGDLAPGEGAYLGAFVGYGMGVLQSKVTTIDQTNATTPHQRSGGTFENDRGGFGFEGIQGGLWAGYGFKTADDIYFGAEITGAGSDEKFELTSTIPLTSSADDNDNFTDITSITARRMWTAGAAARVGYYVNADTLFAVKAGIAVSEFDVDIGDSSEQYYAGGPTFGASIDSRISKIDPNLSLRVEFMVTNYLTADVLGRSGQANTGAGTGGYDAELTGLDTAGRLGLTYNFDVF